MDVRVTDINDQNPAFLQTDYTFRVDEGMSDAYVGTVQVSTLLCSFKRMRIEKNIKILIFQF